MTADPDTSEELCHGLNYIAEVIADATASRELPDGGGHLVYLVQVHAEIARALHRIADELQHIGNRLGTGEA